jgi:hypothetical protein
MVAMQALVLQVTVVAVPRITLPCSFVAQSSHDMPRPGPLWGGLASALQQCVLDLVEEALNGGGIIPEEVDAIAYTKVGLPRRNSIHNMCLCTRLISPLLHHGSLAHALHALAVCHPKGPNLLRSPCG